MQLTALLTISLSVLSTITTANPLPPSDSPFNSSIVTDVSSSLQARTPKPAKHYLGINYCNEHNKCAWIRADDKQCHTLDRAYTQFYPDKGLMCNLYLAIECRGKFGSNKGKLYDVDYNITDIGANAKAVRNGVTGYMSFWC